MNLLSELLAAEEPLFSMSVGQLEQATGRSGVDTRLIGEIIQKSRQTIKQLGLDASDSTGEELYHALHNKIAGHDRHLLNHIGGKDIADVSELLPLLKHVAEKPGKSRTVWVLKRSVAKRLLHASPPQKIMKLLNYSSVDSMIKRENLAEILAAMRFVESSAWLKKFNNSYKQLNPSDFESREIEIVLLDKERYDQAAESYIKSRHHNVVHLKESGVIALLPLSFNKVEGAAIAILPMLLHYINEIRLYSAFFKLQQVKPDFGKIIVTTLNAETSSAVMSGMAVQWRVIHRFYGEQEAGKHPEIFEPHVQPEDLQWLRTEEQLFKIDPELKFWRGLDYVGIMAGHAPVSFNLLDVSLSYFTNAPYQHRHVNHLRGALWNELYMHYMGHKALETQVLKQLDLEILDSERLRI